MRYKTRNRTYSDKKKLKGTEISVMESLTAEKINMLEKGREEHTFNNKRSQDGKIMFFNKNTTKLKLVIVNKFFGDEPDQLWTRICVLSTVVLLRSLLLVLDFFLHLDILFLSNSWQCYLNS